MRFVGSIFGFYYDIELKDEAEFLAWLIEKLKKQNPLLGKILDVLLNESEEFKAIKLKVDKKP